MSEPVYYFAVYLRDTLWAALAASKPVSAELVASELGFVAGALTLEPLDASTFHRLTSGLAPGKNTN